MTFDKIVRSFRFFRDGPDGYKKADEKAIIAQFVTFFLKLFFSSNFNHNTTFPRLFFPAMPTLANKKGKEREYREF